MPRVPTETEHVPASWPHRHLLDLERLTADEIRLLLDTAAIFKEATEGCRRKLAVLTGCTVVNLFFENSTRTRTSFSLAARRLGADVVDFSASTSSLSRRWASMRWWCGTAPPARRTCSRSTSAAA
jgi:aspartate carbamoyltransferase catalytic subunit